MHKVPEIYVKEFLPESFQSRVEGPRSSDEHPSCTSQLSVAGVRR